MLTRSLLVTALFAANAAAQAPASAPPGATPAPAQQPTQRIGDANSRSDAWGTAFEGSDAPARQVQSESERGAASRSNSISGPGARQVPRSDSFTGMSGRGRGGAPLGGGGGRF
jgi:hypothetical protein